MPGLITLKIAMNMKKMIFLIVATVMAFAASAQEEFKRCIFVNGTDTLPYRELTPERPEANHYPLVVFLHGSGERGIDNEKQLIHGAQMWLNPINRKKYPAYVIFPQCPESGFWAYNETPKSAAPDSMPILDEPTKYIKLVRGLVNKYIGEGNIDANRIYLVGLSMGAMAVYDLAERFPGMWAAAVPICGSINPKRLNNARSVHFSIYHGDADPVVPVEASRKAYKRLKELGASVEYTEFPGCSHGSWNPAFNQPNFMKWLFCNVRREK